jgi:hypothetical protein
MAQRSRSIAARQNELAERGERFVQRVELLLEAFHVLR